MNTFLQKTLKELKFAVVGRACGVTRTAVGHWYKKGALPETEHYPHSLNSATNYAGIISKLAKCKKSDLLSQ